MFEDSFENMIRQYDQALSDRKIFVGLMRDLFPEESIRTNLLINVYDLGIVPEIQKALELDKAFAYRFTKQLQEDYGISKKNAEWAVSTWCVCYGKNILQKSCSVAVSTDVSVTKVPADTAKKRTNLNGILPVSLGVDADGDDFIHDFAETPHILVCGHSGTGKTCFVQAVLASMARDHSVDEVGYIIYDSKTTDYLAFNNLPHMLVPVINDGSYFAGALQWAKVVSSKRYHLFAEKQVKSLDAYNRKADEKLPHLFVVIDDLYNLVFGASKDVLEALKYLLVNGRQAGIHFIIVTSMPSSKVLQNDILANLPCRICFAVVSKAESRAILSVNGAEELSVPGQMIFKTQNRFMKCHALHMTEEEIADTIADLDDGSSWSDPSIDQWLKNGGGTAPGTAPVIPAQDYDPMLPQAVEIVMGMGSCSVSMVQRTLKLGYSRASHIVDQMEELGIVGPYEGARPRSVTLDQNGWRELCVKLGYTPPAETKSKPPKREKTTVSAPQDTHDYSKVEIIYTDSTPNETYPTSSEGYISSSSPKVKWKKKAPMPFWLRFMRAIGVLFVVLVIIGMISSAMEERKRGSLPSTEGLSTTSQQSGAAAVSYDTIGSETKLDTVVVPANLVYDGSTQTEYDHFAEEYGFSSIKKEDNGTVTISAETKIPRGNVDALVAALSEKCGKSGYAHFVSVKANENGTVFTIVVNDLNMSEKEKQAVTDLFLMAGLHAVQSGQNVESIRMETRNKLGNLISARETNK